MVWSLIFVLAALARAVSSADDPCIAIAGQTFVAPSKVLACLNSFPFDTRIRDNVVQVVSKTLNFHTSTNYQRLAPEPFSTDVQVDIIGELARIGKSVYPNDFTLHRDVFSSVARLQDGHCTYLNMCYDSLYVSYLPFPLVALSDGTTQTIHIAPEAWDIVKAEFAPYVDTWQQTAGFNFSMYSGAKLVSIGGQDPWTVVDSIANTTGTFQGKSTRQNGVFSSYARGAADWLYRMGDFAARSWPPSSDTIQLTVLRVNQTMEETIAVPFVSRFGLSSTPFPDGPGLWKYNCAVKNSTNGVDYASNPQTISDIEGGIVLSDPSPPRYADPIPVELRMHHVSLTVDTTPLENVMLPPRLNPPTQLAGEGTNRFYLQGTTGILALGGFSTTVGYAEWFRNVTAGFTSLKSQGATHLIIDVTNNGGGFICFANFLHRYLMGPSNLTEPQGGFDTRMRYNSLASNITATIIKENGKRVTRGSQLYDPINWLFGNSTAKFPPNYNFFEPPVQVVVNGQNDAFSQKIGQECGNYPVSMPREPYLPVANIGIITNGRCASSCAILTTTLKEKHGVRVAVIGGKQGETQQYTGTVGGQSSDFSTLDSEIRTVLLKSDPLAPPDLIVNAYQGFVFRQGFGVLDDSHPEEWVDHKADDSFPFTAQTVNNPPAIWKDVATRWWS